LYPHSRGRLTLSGPDPFAAPKIDPGLLSDERDIEPMMRALRLARRFLAGESFRPYRPTEIAPGQGATDDAALLEHLRGTAYTVHHQVGTCRMGSDARAVVDPELRVNGVTGLRVVDASIMPTIVGGNTNAVVVMIAERAADLIRGRRMLDPVSLPQSTAP
jgi:choline dehydrogenase-like flavoprotein